MVNNNGAFSSIVVFKYQDFIGTLWPKIGEISTEEVLENINFGRKLKMINLSLYLLIFLMIRQAQI